MTVVQIVFMYVDSRLQWHGQLNNGIQCLTSKSFYKLCLIEMIFPIKENRPIL